MNVAVSCGSGTRDDQVAVDQVAPDCQSVVTDDVKVILLFPQQSHELPVIADRFHDAEPAPSISCMSIFDAFTLQAVRVLIVHLVDDCTSNLLVAELPPSVRVPVIV